MIDLSFIVQIVLYLLGAGIVFAILYFMITYVGGKFPSEPMTMFVKIAQVFLVVAACLVAIFVVISVITGNQPFVWHRPWW